MLHVVSVCTPCCMLLDVVACCCAKFETGQTFQPATLNISFLPWSPERSTTMLDPFAQLFQHCWGHARSLRMVYKDLWVVSFPRHTVGPTNFWELLNPFAHHCQHGRNGLNSQHCWRNNAGSCCVRLHATLGRDISQCKSDCPVADLGEGPGGPPPFTFRPRNFFFEKAPNPPPPLSSQRLDPAKLSIGILDLLYGKNQHSGPKTQAN